MNILSLFLTNARTSDPPMALGRCPNIGLTTVTYRGTVLLSNQVCRAKRVGFLFPVSVFEVLEVTFTAMTEGTIARVTDRGFGFISRDGEEKDLFFHANELQGVSFDELREGDKVTFEVTEGDKGPSATNVSKA